MTIIGLRIIYLLNFDNKKIPYFYIFKYINFLNKKGAKIYPLFININMKFDFMKFLFFLYPFLLALI